MNDHRRKNLLTLGIVFQSVSLLISSAALWAFSALVLHAYSSNNWSKCTGIVIMASSSNQVSPEYDPNAIWHEYQLDPFDSCLVTGVSPGAAFKLAIYTFLALSGVIILITIINARFKKKGGNTLLLSKLSFVSNSFVNFILVSSDNDTMLPVNQRPLWVNKTACEKLLLDRNH